MTFQRMGALLALTLLLLGVACSKSRQNASIKDEVEQQLQRAGMTDVNVDADQGRLLLTLKGNVKDQATKDQAAQVAQSAASGWTVSNEIAVLPAGDEGDAKAISGNLDDAIEKNFKAALIANDLGSADIKFHAKNGVLTLEGTVDNPAIRDQVQQLGSTVPNTTQVVNKLDVKHQKAAASKR
jgi:osmotically-inducible protein OsmY